jgi:ubiquitin related modifier 1
MTSTVTAPSQGLDTAKSKPSATVHIKIEFSGGLELLFNSQREFAVDVPLPASAPAVGSSSSASSSKLTVRALVTYIAQHLLPSDSDVSMFLASPARPDEGVRPGILVLIDETDYEVLEELETELEGGERVLFVSTLHGG